MFKKKASTIIALLIAIGLIAPLNAWAGSRGHHRSGHHSYRLHVGHRGHYGYGYGGHYGYGYRGHYGYGGRGHYGYGYRGHYGYGYRGHYGYGYGGHYGYGGYYNDGSSHFYGPDGSLYRSVGDVEELGALDLNVKPKNTQVYLNGNYIGATGKFDGFPDYLWLKEGTYELTFYNEGYMTVVQEFVIEAGGVSNVKLRLVPGQSVPPEAPTDRQPTPQTRGSG